MRRTVVLYSLALASGAFALQWLQYQYLTKVFAAELYVVLIAAIFAALGVWAGYRLTPGKVRSTFEKNSAALDSLGVTDREVEVLDLLAAGRSNKEIARDLEVSPNTVKSHVAHLYAKLEVQSRTQAVQAARELGLIP